MIYIVVIYFALLLTVGYSSKPGLNSRDFVFSGRKLTAVPLAMTLVTTWYGAISSVGQEVSYNGITTWLYFGATYYVAAFVYSEFISSRVIDLEISSIPMAIYKYMGKISALLSVPIVLLYISPAPYLIILGNIINTSLLSPLGIDAYGASVAAGSSVAMLYCLKGGFSSIVRTDRIQFILMFVGFITMVLYLVFYFDPGLSKLLQLKVARPDLFNFPGSAGWSYVVAWGFLAMITFLDPSFHQRTFASKNKNEIKKAIRLSICGWFVFDMMTIFCGLYAVSLGVDMTSPYVSLSAFLFSSNSILHGIFIVAILSVVMSTIDSFTFLSAMVIGKDLPAILNKSYSTGTIRKGILSTIVISLLIVGFFDNSRVVEIWFAFGSYMVASLLVPFVLIILRKKVNHPYLLIAVPSAVTLIWTLLEIQVFLPMYAGLFFSLILSLLLLED